MVGNARPCLESCEANGKRNYREHIGRANHEGKHANGKPVGIQYEQEEPWFSTQGMLNVVTFCAFLMHSWCVPAYRLAVISQRFLQ